MIPRFSDPPGGDRAYIALGSNLGARRRILSSAVDHLRGLGAGLRASTIYETRPLGPARYPFLNAVVELAGAFVDPEALLAALLRIEAAHGRERRLPWGPRTLDLDLLLVLQGGECLRWSSPTLTLPHPHLGDRDFVLAPLAELAPDLRPDAADTRRVVDLLGALPAAARTLLIPTQDRAPHDTLALP